MSTTLTVAKMNGGVDVSRYDDKEMIQTLKDTVAKNATDSEFRMFIEVCKSTGLNPFLKEIWCAVPMKNGQRNPYGQVLIMAARDGYLRVANENPMFDGIETRVERDEKTKTPIKAVCTVWRKDRAHPTIAEAYFSEYYKPSFSDKPGIWDIYKSAMIGKVAEVLALKRSFSINGVVTEEEIGALETVEETKTRADKIADAKAVAERKIVELQKEPLTIEAAPSQGGEDPGPPATAEWIKPMMAAFTGMKEMLGEAEYRKIMGDHGNKNKLMKEGRAVATQVYRDMANRAKHLKARQADLDELAEMEAKRPDFHRFLGSDCGTSWEDLQGASAGDITAALAKLRG